jgi:hypothetical protein
MSVPYHQNRTLVLVVVYHVSWRSLAADSKITSTWSHDGASLPAVREGQILLSKSAAVGAALRATACSGNKKIAVDVVLLLMFSLY